MSGDGHVHGLGDFDLTAAGEIAPSLAAILAFADAPTRMLGIGHLRGHETNRLEALVTEITRIGGEARELEDGIEITPVPVERLHGEVMESYADHRMATFAAMIEAGRAGRPNRQCGDHAQDTARFRGHVDRHVGAVTATNITDIR